MSEQTEGRLAIKVLSVVTGLACTLAAAAFGWAWKTNERLVSIEKDVAGIEITSLRTDMQALREEMILARAAKQHEDAQDSQIRRFWKLHTTAYDALNELETKVQLPRTKWPDSER